MKHKKRILIALVLVGVLVLGTLGGVALAQTTDSPNSSGTSLMARVAAILGLDQQKVEDAFAQAQKDMQAEAINAQLQAMVEDGTITQDQAGQYQNWWQSMPTMPTGTDLPGVGGMRGMRGPAPMAPGLPPTSDSSPTTQTN